MMKKKKLKFEKKYNSQNSNLKIKECSNTTTTQKYWTEAHYDRAHTHI